MGADRKLANWDKLLAYYQTLAKSAPNLRLVELGKSSENRPYIALFISSPANLARLDRLRQLNARLADPRGLSEAEARKIVTEARAVVIQSFALHSSEVAASQTAAEYVYDSVTRKDEEAQRMLDNVISIVVPSINPDGTQMIADWYMEHVGTPLRGRGAAVALSEVFGPRQQPRRLRAEPAGVPEPRQADVPRLAAAGLRRSSPDGRRQRPALHPAVRGADPARTAIRWCGGRSPGGARRWATVSRQSGKTGVIGNAIYSGWGHMGFHWITPFHNIAGMLTESASARLATPMFIHPDQLRGGPRNLPEYEPQTNMPSVWPGGWWRVRDIVEQQKIAAWATVDLAARNREVVLWNMYLKGTRQTERGAKGEVKAYAIPMPQHDSLTARKLANMLLNSGVEVHQTTAPMTIEGRVYGPGSYVVSMAQPKMGLIRWMLGRTFYPDNTYTRDREGNPIRPYDMATDTFAEFMGVRCDPLADPMTQGLTKMTGAGLARRHGGRERGERLRDQHEAERRVSRREPAARQGRDGSPRAVRRRLHAGRFRRHRRRRRRSIAEVAKQTGVDFAALTSAVPPAAYALRKPRIAMYQRYGGGNMDEGWSRLMFEQFDIPVKPLMDAEIRKGDLNASYDAIILPADSVAAMTGEAAAAGRRRSRRRPGGGGGRRRRG